MRNKLVTAILTVLMLLLVVPSKALAATGDSGLPYYVSDVAEILSDGQRQDLESTAEKISSQYGCGVYIVTLDDYREYDSKSDMFSFAQDFYRTLLRKEAEQTELIWISRASVLIIASLAIFIGLNPSSFILDMVAYAWAGFGAAFGPALLCSLFWRRTTRNGVLAGIIVGGITVLVWKQIDWLGLYEIVPGFLLSLIAVLVVSKMDREPSASVVNTFDAVGKSEI